MSEHKHQDIKDTGTGAVRVSCPELCDERGSREGGRDAEYCWKWRKCIRIWRCLDVATGGGHTAHYSLHPHVKRVVATDLTQKMLDAAQAFITPKVR